MFGLLPGAGNHCTSLPQHRPTMNTLISDLYEPFLEDNTPAMKFLPPLYVEGAKQISHKDIDGPFYSSTYFTDRLLGFLRERDEEKPFFAYLPYTAPHCTCIFYALRQVASEAGSTDRQGRCKRQTRKLPATRDGTMTVPKRCA